MSLALLPDTAVWAWLRVHSPPAVHWSSKCNQPARTQLPNVPLESLQKQNETVTHSWGSRTSMKRAEQTETLTPQACRFESVLQCRVLVFIWLAECCCVFYKNGCGNRHENTLRREYKASLALNKLLCGSLMWLMWIRIYWIAFKYRMRNSQNSSLLR